MYYNFIYPDVRINPEYKYDEVMYGYNYNFSIIDLWQLSGVTLGGVTLSGGTIYAPSGGTIGGIVFSGGSISPVNSINFNTNPFSINQTGGTLFYAPSVNALSYNPITPNNDVTVNIGQESLIYIYNDLPIAILNGQAVHITGSTSGTPTVGLAIAQGGSNSLFQVSGIATHNIPSGEFGFITNFGRVNNIDVSAFSEGDQLFLSETTLGGFALASQNSVTSRTAEIGTVLSGGVNGSIFVDIHNEYELSNTTVRESNIFSVNNLSSGVFEFGGLSITSGNTFSVGRIKGWVVNDYTNPINPSVKYIEYSGSSGNTTPYLTAYTETYVLLTTGNTLYLSSSFPTEQERRQNIYLGKLGHADKSNLINAFNEPDFISSPTSQLRDMFTLIRLLNGGITPYANGSNLNFNTTAGKLYGLGINFVNDKLNPDVLDITAKVPVTFQYRVQTGGTFANTTTIVPNLYDVGGVLTPVGGGSNSSTNQRIYLLQNGQIRVQYGQHVYANLASAISAAQNENFIVFPNFRSVGILIGILSVNKNATNLSDTNQAVFLPTTMFGETLGAAGGFAIGTLQTAYNNSITPEIVTNSSLGALSLKQGSGSDADIVLEIENGFGDITMYVSASGRTTTTDLTISGITEVSGYTRQIVSDSNGNIYFQTSTNIDSGGEYLPLSGGTVSGNTIFNSLSASTLYVENEIWTIELMDAQVVDFYAPYDMKINSISNVLNSPTITIQDDGSPYTLTNTITIGSKVTVSASTASVVNLNATK